MEPDSFWECEKGVGEKKKSAKSSQIGSHMDWAEFSGQNFKRGMLRLQQFYNIFTTNHGWLVIIGSSLNLVLKLLF